MGPPPRSSLRRLPTPEIGRSAAERFVAEHLAGLYWEPEVVSSPRFRGGPRAADQALERFDVTGYAKHRNEAYPEARRGASQLSPYIRHGLLTLPQVWDRVAGGPPHDVAMFRDELRWQEYARHWYARLGRRTARPTRRRFASVVEGGVWDLDMACLELTIGELEDDGWLVNQTRMWLASHWSVRQRHDWRQGEDFFFRHLLDGSRAANRLGWQWTTGVGSTKAYGFSRWQVEKRAPGLCATCELADRCPIADWPPDPGLEPIEPDAALGHDPDPDATAGPAAVDRRDERRPEAVWLTAESLGQGDPALAAHPDLPAVFVLDRPLLARLRLSSKRLVFLIETLAELAPDRPVELWLGDLTAGPGSDPDSGPDSDPGAPAQGLIGRPLATTFAPVPGWRRRADRLELIEVHPWPWLRRPTGGTIASFAAWTRSVDGLEA